MAINVNTVYRTVLLILNKEQRGYMTPDEFNKIGTQVQREIFERYFEDLNQQSRLSKNDVDYANRLELTEEKLQEFKTYSSPAYAASTDDFPVPTDLYKLGNIAFRKVNYDTTNAVSTYSQNYKELQRVNRHDFNLIRRSKLVEPSKNYGVFLYEGDRIKVHPKIAQVNGQTPIELDYLKKPDDVRWGYTIGGLGQFLYDSTTYDPPTYPGPTDPPTAGSTNFLLHNSEQAEVVLNILLYAGVVIRDPQAVQTAMAQVQKDEANEKQ